MSTRVAKTTLVLAALGAACSLLFASSASASPAGGSRELIKPPAGIPDLSSMALKTSDLSPGARVLRQGYVRPGSGFVASYTREFRTGTARLRGKRFLYLENSIELLQNVADAQLFYNLVRLFSTRIDPDELAADFANESGIKVRYVRIGRPVPLRVGNQSFAFRVRIGTRLGEFHVVTAVVRVDRIVAYVGIGGLPKTKVGTPEAKALVRPVGRRMADGLRPVNRVLPSITGTAAVGQTLTASTGSWINQPTGYTYTWRRCDAAAAICTSISGATSSTYVLTAADGGFTIRVVVTARNARGSRPATSFATQIVAGPPVNTMLPTISGGASVGLTLMVSPGSWSAGVTGYTYAWRRCDIAGANCVDIVGETGQSYVVTATDSGHTIRAAVTASSAHGPTTAVSAQTNLVP